jgi:hypothetical protein
MYAYHAELLSIDYSLSIGWIEDTVFVADNNFTVTEGHLYM